MTDFTKLRELVQLMGERVREESRKRRLRLERDFPDIHFTSVTDAQLPWVDVMVRAGLNLPGAIAAVERAMARHTRTEVKYDFHEFRRTLESLMWLELDQALCGDVAKADG